MRVLAIILLLLAGCSPKISQEDLQQLNGYWEIEKVTFPNGKTKDFMSSTTIDYIELDGMKGFRKKVQPKFDGTYETSNDAEFFVIEKKGDTFEIHYNPNMALHPSMHPRESLVLISKDNFSVTNKDSLTYSYKKYQPINLNN